MAEIIWTEPALSDLEAIADYIALDNPEAAKALVQRVFRRVEQLARYPKSGSKPAELKGWRYRQIVESPCRIFYRHERFRQPRNCNRSEMTTDSIPGGAGRGIHEYMNAGARVVPPPHDGHVCGEPRSFDGLYRKFAK